MNIVLCGFPRSGSTMLYSMFFNTLSGYKMFDTERTALNHSVENDVFTKRPLDVFSFREILSENPNTYFIVTVRDVRSVICSKHASVPDDYFIGGDDGYFVTKGIPKKSGVGIVDFFDCIKDMIESISEKIFLVKYEDVVKNPDDVQEQLVGKFNFAFKNSFSTFHTRNVPKTMSKALNGIRGVDQNNIHSWKEHIERVKKEFENTPKLFDVLEYFSYETDRKWFNEL